MRPVATTISLPGLPLERADGPLYRQAAARLRSRIATSSPGATLPKEGEIASALGVSLITVRAALRALADEGLIRKRAGRAALVAEPPPRPLNSLGDVIAATTGARLEIAAWRPRRLAEAAEAFGLPPATACPCLSGRLLVREQPLCEVTIFFPPDIGRRLARSDFDDVVVFRSVERRLGLRFGGARITVGAEPANARLARTLEIAEGAPVLTSRILYKDDAGTPAEFTIARHRADRYRLTYEFPGG